MRGNGRRRQSATARSERRASAVSAPANTSRADIAAYVGRLAKELVELARLAELKTLAYLADMVRLEAEQQVELIRARENLPPSSGHSSDTRPPGSR